MIFSCAILWDGIILGGQAEQFKLDLIPNTCHTKYTAAVAVPGEVLPSSTVQLLFFLVVRLLLRCTQRNSLHIYLVPELKIY